MIYRHGASFGWGLALVLIAGCLSLGRWQLARMHEKQARQEAAAKVIAERRPQPLAAASDARRRRDYDWAAGDGWFPDAPAVLLDNQSYQERAGVRAYRLFLAADGTGLLVELGWLPLGGDRKMPTIAPIPGPTRVSGLLMPPPTPGLVAPVAKTQSDGAILTTAVDVTEVASLLGRHWPQQRRLPPRILRLDPALQMGYIRDLDILPNTLPPQRHLGYAVQWFALAVAVLVTALLLTFRKPRAYR